jgi:hypothetical protein
VRDCFVFAPQVVERVGQVVVSAGVVWVGGQCSAKPTTTKPVKSKYPKIGDGEAVIDAWVKGTNGGTVKRVKVEDVDGKVVQLVSSRGGNVLETFVPREDKIVRIIDG